MPRFYRYLAAAVAALAAFVAAPAMAQTGTWTVSVAASPFALGRVVTANTGATTFTIATNGAVTQSGTAIRRDSNLANAVATITCTGTGSNCNAGVTGKVRIGSFGSPTGKAGALTSFTVSSAATISGVTGTGTGQLDFTIALTSKNQPVTVNIGANFPIRGLDGAGATGAATSGFYVYAKNTGTPTAGDSTKSGSADVSRGLSVTPSALQMNFGTIKRPPVTNSVVTLDTTSGSGLVTADANGAIPVGATNNVTYTLGGEPSKLITVSIPSPMVLTGPGGATISVNLATSTLPTALDGTGAQSFTVGGNFTVAHTTAEGVYNGSYNVTVAYN